MRGLAILVIVVMLFWLLWPVIARWMKRKAMERAEDYFRSSMGMPPRDKKRKRNDRNSSYQSSYYQQRRRQGTSEASSNNGPIIPKEYAEDVEYTEIKDYSFSERTEHVGTKGKIYHESQISDVEWTEIKIKK